MAKNIKKSFSLQEVVVDKEVNKIYVYKIRAYLLNPVPYYWEINMREVKKIKALLI